MEAIEEITTVSMRETLAETVNLVSYAKKRMIITRRGKPVAAIVPLEDLTVLSKETE